jgi:hypothetical protein
MKKNKFTQYLDGGEVRIKNRRINFKEKDGNILLRFEKTCEKDADKPAAIHSCKREKVRITELSLSKEAFDSLIILYCHYNDFQKPSNPGLKETKTKQ